MGGVPQQTCGVSLLNMLPFVQMGSDFLKALVLPGDSRESQPSSDSRSRLLTEIASVFHFSENSALHYLSEMQIVFVRACSRPVLVTGGSRCLSECLTHVPLASVTVR